MELFDTHVTKTAKENVMHCLNSGRLSEGELVAKFENALELTFGYKNALAVNSGTSALHLALICVDVGPGDEVIIPAQTFVATGMVVLQCGAKVVFADIGMDGNISVDSVSRKITDKTKAVICVSWGGNPCALNELSELCASRDLVLIQDNAQALGAVYEDQLGAHPIDYWGDFSCFSFQATKHLTTGDGGLLTCSQKNEYLFAKDIRWFGISRDTDLPDETGERRYDLSYVGYKYHMSDYAAALGLGNLDNVWKRIKRRSQIADHYDKGLPRTYLINRHSGSSNWLYTILVDRRDDFIRAMKSKGIPASVVHNGIDRNEVFGGFREELIYQRHWDKHHVCLPCHPSLTSDDIQKIVEAINEGW